MKKYLTVLFSILIFSCAQDMNKVQSEAVEAYEESEVILEDDADINLDGISNAKPEAPAEMEIDEEMSLEFNEQKLEFAVFKSPLMSVTEQKVEEYFDLIQLKKQHPEFEEDIKTQLQQFSSDSTIGMNYAKDFKIENLIISNPFETLSNQSKSAKLYFDVVNDENRVKDSIYAVIKQKDTLIDGKTISSYKVRFKKID